MRIDVTALQSAPEARKPSQASTEPSGVGTGVLGVPAAHPRYQELPPLSPFDFAALKDSIAEHGMLDPVVVDEFGHTLDGHHRMRAVIELRAQGADITIPEPRVLFGLTDAEKRNYALMVNLARRQMSIEQKRELWRQHHDEIRARLVADPKRSDLEIAREVGVTDKTVAKQRRVAEDKSEIRVLRAAGRAERVEPLPEPVEADSRAIANHLGMTRFVLTVYFPSPSSEERTRHGLPYPRESVQDFWTCERMITTPPPTSYAEIDRFCLDIAQQTRAHMRDNPMPTMMT